MDTESFWTFIKDNIISLTSVVSGFLVLLLHGMGVLPFEVIAGATLALVALLATSEVVERQRRLYKLEEMVQGLTEKLAQGTGYSSATEFSSEEVYSYIAYLMSKTKESILWASPETRKGSQPDVVRPYEAALQSAVSSGRVSLTWISKMSGKTRIERAQNLIFGEHRNSRVFVRALDEQCNNFPQFSFLIFDEKTLVTRAPFRRGGRSKYLVITDLLIVELFMRYFDRLVEVSQLLEPNDTTRRLLNEALAKTT